MTSSPLVSIIIPLYNSEDYIFETINSALEQTHTNIEIIVVDDFSTDSSYQLVESINNPKIFLHKNLKKGACAARNRGFELSKGEYIQYLDADDLLSKTKIEKQLKLLTKEDSIANCGWNFFKDNDLAKNYIKQAINKNYDNPGYWLIDSFLGNGMGIISAWLTPKNIIQKAGVWNEKLLINQDGEFFCRVILNSSSIVFIPELLAHYRRNDSSITQSKRSIEKIESQLLSYKLCEEHLLLKTSKIEAIKAIGNLYLKFIYHNDRISKKLSDRAWEYFYNLNIGNPWVVGGGKFKKMASIIGFKNALKIIKLLN